MTQALYPQLLMKDLNVEVSKVKDFARIYHFSRTWLEAPIFKGGWCTIPAIKCQALLQCQRWQYFPRETFRSRLGVTASFLPLRPSQISMRYLMSKTRFLLCICGLWLRSVNHIMSTFFSSIISVRWLCQTLWRMKDVNSSCFVDAYSLLKFMIHKLLEESKI